VDRSGDERAGTSGLEAVRLRGGAYGLITALLGLVAAAFFGLPLLGVFLQGNLHDGFSSETARAAFRVTAETSAISLAVMLVVGTPVAYRVATSSFPGKTLLVTLFELPLVLPPAVAGIGLFAAFGRTGLLGSELSALGIELPFTPAAVVMAMTFVAGPLYLRQAQEAFAAVDPDLLAAARTLGAGKWKVFGRVAVPLAGSGLGAGAALAWARAVGEFGATIMFAGSLQGVTQTAPIATYLLFEQGDFGTALALGAALIAISGAVLLTVKLIVRGRTLRFGPM
jgi:molybdate transport system permease protein